MPKSDEPCLRHLLDEIAERAYTVVALRKRRVELQQRALQQAQLRRDLAIRQYLERPLHERDRLGDVCRCGNRDSDAILAARARTWHAWLAADEVLVGDELVTVLLHHLAGELPAAGVVHLLVVLLQLLDERDEIAVSPDDDERVDVVVGKRHLERIEREIDVRAVLVSSGREVTLHHADRMLRHEPAVVTGALPVAVGDLGHHFAPLLDAVQNRGDVELRMQRGLHTDFDVVEIDEDRNFHSLIDQIVFSLRTLTFFPRIFVAFSAAIIRSASASGTSTNENLSAISMAPSERDGTSASPVIAPTRSPGRIPASRPAPMNTRTPSPLRSRPVKRFTSLPSRGCVGCRFGACAGVPASAPRAPKAGLPAVSPPARKAGLPAVAPPGAKAGAGISRSSLPPSASCAIFTAAAAMSTASNSSDNDSTTTRTSSKSAATSRARSDARVGSRRLARRAATVRILPISDFVFATRSMPC